MLVGGETNEVIGNAIKPGRQGSYCWNVAFKKCNRPTCCNRCNNTKQARATAVGETLRSTRGRQDRRGKSYVYRCAKRNVLGIMRAKDPDPLADVSVRIVRVPLRRWQALTSRMLHLRPRPCTWVCVRVERAGNPTWTNSRRRRQIFGAFSTEYAIYQISIHVPQGERSVVPTSSKSLNLSWQFSQ